MYQNDFPKLNLSHEKLQIAIKELSKKEKR